MGKREVIVVTGAGGFIGGHLVKQLLGEGHEVRAADIKPLGQWYQVHRAAKNFAGPIKGDCRDFKVCRTVSTGATTSRTGRPTASAALNTRAPSM